MTDTQPSTYLGEVLECLRGPRCPKCPQCLR